MSVWVRMDEANETWTHRFLFCTLWCHQQKCKYVKTPSFFVKRFFSWEADTWHFSVGFCWKVFPLEVVRSWETVGSLGRWSAFPSSPRVGPKRLKLENPPNASRRWTSQHVLGWPGWITQPGWDSVPCWPKDEWHHPGGHGDNPDET